MRDPAPNAAGVMPALDALIALARYRLSTKRREFDKHAEKGKEPHDVLVTSCERAEYLLNHGEEARAAVAELVEAARALADSQSRLWERGNAYISARGAQEMNAARDRTRAALARVGGVS